MKFLDQILPRQTHGHFRISSPKNNRAGTLIDNNKDIWGLLLLCFFNLVELRRLCAPPNK